MQSLLTGLVFSCQKKTYQKCSSLYDFCRTVDDIADDQNELDIKKKTYLFLSMILLIKISII